LGLALLGLDEININILSAIRLLSQPDVINLAYEKIISNIAIIGFCPGLTNMKSPNKRQAPDVVRNPKTKFRSPSSDKTFNAKSPMGDRTLQHICKAHKTHSTNPTLQKSCNCQHTADSL
jgi:hypothetical protein